MTKRRDKIEMIQEILVLCCKPRRVTAIIRLANIQYNSFNEIVEPLVAKGFMVQAPVQTKDDKRTMYKWMTTATGRAFMGEIGEVLGQLSGAKAIRREY